MTNPTKTTTLSENESVKSFKLRGDVNFDFDILAWLKPQFSLGVNFYELPIALIEFCNIYLFFVVVFSQWLRNFCAKCKKFHFLSNPGRIQYQQGINSRLHTEIQLLWVFIGSVYFRDLSAMFLWLGTEPASVCRCCPSWTEIETETAKDKMTQAQPKTLQQQKHESQPQQQHNNLWHCTVVHNISLKSLNKVPLS